MTTLSPFAICLPASSVSRVAVRRMCASGVCQRMISLTMFGIRLGMRAQLLVLVRVLVQREDAARDRVARRVVAADDQQDQRAEVFHRRQVRGSRRAFASAVTKSSRSVGGRSSRCFQSAGEHLEALHQRCPALLLGHAGGAHLLRARGRHVRPERELAALLVRKVEERREHPRRQLDRDAVDPVEGLADGQAVEDLDAPLADQRLEPREVARRGDRLHDLAVGVVLGAVHRDEAGLEREVGIGIARSTMLRADEKISGFFSTCTMSS